MGEVMQVVKDLVDGDGVKVLRFMVQAVCVCPECGGSGWVTHPAWVLYWLENPPKGEVGRNNLDEAWFRENGYWDVPDEEVFCGICDGRGEVIREFPLIEALGRCEINFAVREGE